MAIEQDDAAVAGAEGGKLAFDPVVIGPPIGRPAVGDFHLVRAFAACRAFIVLLGREGDERAYLTPVLGFAATVYAVQWDYRAVNTNTIFLLPTNTHLSQPLQPMQTKIEM